jgi:hypothetical protein
MINIWDPCRKKKWKNFISTFLNITPGLTIKKYTKEAGTGVGVASSSTNPQKVPFLREQHILDTNAGKQMS